jgi:Flp pilus assembly protein TadG
MRRATGKVRERGAAAVEFAVTVPVLLAIVFGTIDWGYYFFHREIVVNAAREGARAGTLKYDDPSLAAAEAQRIAQKYLTDAGLLRPATIDTQHGADGVSTCDPDTTSCLQITYQLGGSVTGFLGKLVPAQIVAYSQMRK